MQPLANPRVAVSPPEPALVTDLDAGQFANLCYRERRLLPDLQARRGFTDGQDPVVHGGHYALEWRAQATKGRRRSQRESVSNGHAQAPTRQHSSRRWRILRGECSPTV